MAGASLAGLIFIVIWAVWLTQKALDHAGKGAKERDFARAQTTGDWFWYYRKWGND